MGRYLKVICLLLYVGTLFSCKKDEQLAIANPTQIDLYFPLSDFLQKNIGKLEFAEVVKEIHFNDETEIVDFSLDSLAWRQELDFFFQSDINKAALASAYETKEEPDLLVHQLKPNEKGNIKLIKVKKNAGKVVNITILSEISNMFYQSTVEGLIILDANEEISSYEMSGDQKVWFLPGTNLHVEGKVK
ncbi:hypothetical protein [uncultured Cyclobacterium sp.]|uniref:hypothetical protein n=1 Tax=uncultured Cyclobacterium sp. TaxID=453820 RepID=UPI0030EB7D6F|tara:strand:+ start:124439 stop:125005 length:567 start_codon:yes stop_codon:yes gene_type:complete